MCLAIPGKVIKINDTEAVIDYDGVTKIADICLMEKVIPGDLVLVHAGFVIQVLDLKSGEELKKAMKTTLDAVKKDGF